MRFCSFSRSAFSRVRRVCRSVVGCGRRGCSTVRSCREGPRRDLRERAAPCDPALSRPDRERRDEEQYYYTRRATARLASPPGRPGSRRREVAPGRRDGLDHYVGFDVLAATTTPPSHARLEVVYKVPAGTPSRAYRSSSATTTSLDASFSGKLTVDSSATRRSYNGETYKPGDTFKSSDDCNTCSCQRERQRRLHEDGVRLQPGSGALAQLQGHADYLPDHPLCV